MWFCLACLFTKACIIAEPFGANVSLKACSTRVSYLFTGKPVQSLTVWGTSTHWKQEEDRMLLWTDYNKVWFSYICIVLLLPQLLQRGPQGMAHRFALRCPVNMAACSVESSQGPQNNLHWRKGTAATPTHYIAASFVTCVGDKQPYNVIYAHDSFWR